MRNLIILALAAITLAGCSKKPLEVDRVTSIRSNSGSSNTDVYASRRKRGEKVPALAGDQIVAVRTYADNSGGFGRGDEISGAKCTLRASNFTASVTTPAKVRLPIYRLQSSTISIRCGKKGYKSRTVQHGVYNKTKNDRYAMAAPAAGLVGVLAIVAINAMSNEKTHDFRYPPMNVVLKPLGKKKK